MSPFTNNVLEHTSFSQINSTNPEPIVITVPSSAEIKMNRRKPLYQNISNLIWRFISGETEIVIAEEKLSLDDKLSRSHHAQFFDLECNTEDLSNCSHFFADSVLNEECRGILMFNQNISRCENFCTKKQDHKKRSSVIREGWTLYTRSVTKQ